MRLLILTPEYDGSGGGIMTFYQSLIPALQGQGVEVRIVEGSAYHAAEDKSPRVRHGASVETLEANRVGRWHSQLDQFAATPGLRAHLAAAWAMWEQAQFGEDADVVEACDWGMLFAPIALDAMRPLVVQCHGSIGQIAHHDPIAAENTQSILTFLVERSILAEVDTIQTPGCANAAYWRDETGRHVSMMRPAWIPPTVQTSQEHNSRGLVVGRVQRWKGPQVLCAALNLLGNRAPNIDWVGRDTPWESAHGSTSAHLLTTYPHVWGKNITPHVPKAPAEVGCLQAGALFNLVPSTWDVFNFTAVEAMASGRPTIISTGAGAHELIEDGRNGYVFPSGNAEALASVIERVLAASPAQLAEIGRAAQSTIRRELDPSAIAAQRVAAYRSTIDGFNNRRPSVQKTLGEMCRPKDCSSNDDNASFLDQVALRTLMKHVARRFHKKVLGSRTSGAN